MLAVTLAVLLTGCRAQRQIIEVPVKTVEVVTEKLVPVEIPGDSALLQALFWCDSLNQVQMLRFEELKSNRINTSLLFRNGLLTYRVIRAPSQQMVPYRTVEKTTEVPIRVEVPVIENRLSWFQKIFFYFGIVSAVAAATWMSANIFIKR